MDIYSPSRTQVNVHEIKIAFQRGRHKAVVFGSIVSEFCGADVLAEITDTYENDLAETLLAFVGDRNADTLSPIFDSKTQEIVGVNLHLSDGSKGTKMVISEDHESYLTGVVISSCRPATDAEASAYEEAAAEDDGEEVEDSDEEEEEEDDLSEEEEPEGPSEEELAKLEAASQESSRKKPRSK